MRCRASITLFMCMTIMMIASLGFTLMESIRYTGSDTKAEFVTSTVADNTFSEYIRPLWEQYGILAIDRAYNSSDETDSKLKERIMSFANMQLDSEIDYYALNPLSVEIDDYMLLTDYDGEPFIHEAATYYKDNIASELIDQMASNVASASDYEQASNNIDKMITDGNSSLKNAPVPKKEDGEDTKVPDTHLTDEQKAKGETLLDDVGSFKSRGVLDQVLPKDKEVSDKSFELNGSVSHRAISKGNSPNSSMATSIDKIIFSAYLKDHFQCFTKSLGHSGQKYELEYIIAGADNDTDNLKGTVKRLLAIREVADFATLYNDAVRNGEAMELAIAVAGWTLNPVIIEIVHMAFMAAWAYVEAVLDVRLLLDNGKVPLLKNSSEWTSDLYDLALCTDPQFTAYDTHSGLSYQEYLILLMIIEPNSVVSMRALDMIETSMNAIEDYESLKMDHLICDMDMTVTYEASPMFFSLVSLDIPFMDLYTFNIRKHRSYL